MKRDPKLHYFECYYNEIEATVGIWYSPGRPGRWTMANGDPGYPDEPPEVEIREVWVNDREVSETLPMAMLEELETMAFEKMDEARREGADNDAAEAYQARRDARDYG